LLKFSAELIANLREICCLHSNRKSHIFLLILQIIGSISAVSSSLFVGKAGPMVHTGACVAALLGQGGSKRFRLTWRWLHFFRNDRDRRDLVTCGSAAGIAAGFRAPVGGVLFALEEMASWYVSCIGNAIQLNIL
jgi:chloride channel 7